MATLDESNRIIGTTPAAAPVSPIMSSIQDMIAAFSPQQLARLVSSETLDAMATFEFADGIETRAARVPARAPASSVPGPAPVSRPPLKVLNGFMAFRSM